MKHFTQFGLTKMPELMISDPNTWKHLQDHPAFKKFEFCKEWRTWYEGDNPENDLHLLRQCAIELLKNRPDTKTELVLLDDLTVFVEIRIGGLTGQFGIGISPNTVFVQLDPNPSNCNALATEVDGLSISQFVQTVCQFAEDSDFEA
ncbi:MAG: hypothetical protein ACIAZJ_21110 [Gimesia chilikensis]|uniref:hypothetical protein n=1 Tax=Gimesia chilikensis TaxID=2605989 RepID=UPI0037B88E36